MYKDNIKLLAKLLKEETTLLDTHINVKIEYAKGIVDSIELYKKLIKRIELINIKDEKDQALYNILKHHIEEDNVELQEARSLMDKDENKELDNYIKNLSFNKNPNKIDLSKELDEKDIRKLNKDLVDDKNQLDEDDNVMVGDGAYGYLFKKYADDMEKK